jgi:hypothetical protein
VTFGGVPATGVTVSSDSSATAVAPAHTAGAVEVSVTTPGGTDTLGGSFTYLDPPSVTSVSPPTGPVAGGTAVTVTGTGFVTGTAVTFDGLPAAVSSVTSTTLTVTAPAHPAGAVDVVVTSPGGVLTLVDGYTYLAAPTLSGISPDSGTDAGGTAVTLTGDHLSGTTVVTFGGVPATDVLVVDDQTVTATAPAGSDGPVDVVATTPSGAAILPGGFTYTP